MSVITSYSIHYTKLYEFKDIYLKYPKEAEKFFKNPAEYDARLINAESLIEALERFLDGIEKIKSLHSSVITSYSIHYTKLYEYTL